MMSRDQRAAIARRSVRKAINGGIASAVRCVVEEEDNALDDRDVSGRVCVKRRVRHGQVGGVERELPIELQSRVGTNNAESRGRNLAGLVAKFRVDRLVIRRRLSSLSRECSARSSASRESGRFERKGRKNDPEMSLWQK